MRTLQELADKLEWEGGIGEGIHYFGRTVDTDNEHFNYLWRELYDAYQAVADMLPEPSPEDASE